jgi:hypothetical protein
MNDTNISNQITALIHGLLFRNPIKHPDAIFRILMESSLFSLVPLGFNLEFLME